MSYWAYQHLGNLPPEDRMDDATYRAVRAADGDAGPIVREFAFAADREVAGARWSYRRDIGRTRIVMMDSRAGRVLRPESRHMVDAEEWDCIERWTRGSFDHLLLGTSLPAFLGRGMHFIEAWNEAVCEGAWGRTAARVGERIRRAVDLEHWAAFGDSLRDLEDLLERIASGRHGETAPGSVVLLSGDVHHAYLARAEFAVGQRRPQPRLPGRLLAVAQPAQQPRAPGDPDRHVARRGARRPCARPRRRGARGIARLDDRGGPVVRQPGRDARARRPRADGWSSTSREPAGRPAAPRAGDATATVLTRQSG